MNYRVLTALPVFNELPTLAAVLSQVRLHCPEILVVNDGSTDGTTEWLNSQSEFVVENHVQNRGYGAALMTAFAYAQRQGYDYLVTMDCDGQHEPGLIVPFVNQLHATQSDLISGSRYLPTSDQVAVAPVERRRINFQITQYLNARLRLKLTDSFCGFKAYRVSSLAQLQLTEPGYAMPLELWVQIARFGWRTQEAPVPLIYLDEKRSFGAALDNGDARLKYYLDVIERSLATMQCSAAHHI